MLCKFQLTVISMIHAFLYGLILALGLIIPLSEPYSTQRQIGFAASVSLLNPHALLDTISVIGISSLHFIGKEKVIYTLACILVSWSWFFGLSVAGHFLHRLDKSGLTIKIINKVSALIIWGVAIYIAMQLFLQIR